MVAMVVATGYAAEEGEVRGFAKNGVVNYFSKCSRSDSRFSFLPRPFRVEASRGRWLFQFPGVPTRLNFYRRRRRRLAADHFARYRVTGLCLRKWLRASRFFSVMLLSPFSIMFSFFLASLHAPTFSSVSIFSLLPISSLPTLCSVPAKLSFGETNQMNATSKALTLIDRTTANCVSLTNVYYIR